MSKDLTNEWTEKLHKKVEALEKELELANQLHISDQRRSDQYIKDLEERNKKLEEELMDRKEINEQIAYSLDVLRQDKVVLEKRVKKLKKELLFEKQANYSGTHRQLSEQVVKLEKFAKYAIKIIKPQATKESKATRRIKEIELWMRENLNV